MTPELRTIAEQITTLPGWKWLPGLCVINPDGRRSNLLGARDSVPGWLPDITDPATGGVLLSLMNDPSLELGRGQDGAPAWYCLVCPDDGEWVPGYGATPGEAIARLAVARGRWA